MEKVLDVFAVIEGGRLGGGLGGFSFVARLSRIDPYAKVRDCRLSSRNLLPLKIHSRLKSGSEIWSLRTAWVLVMKFFAWPDVPTLGQKF